MNMSVMEWHPLPASSLFSFFSFAYLSCFGMLLVYFKILWSKLTHQNITKYISQPTSYELDVSTRMVLD